MKPLPHFLSTVKSRDEFHLVTTEWCLAHRFHYNMSLGLRKNISAARRQAKFIVATALTEAVVIYERLG